MMSSRIAFSGGAQRNFRFCTGLVLHF